MSAEVDLWVPGCAREQLPPPMTLHERLLADRLIRAEIRAAKYEMALRAVLAVSQLEAQAIVRTALQ
jgi:hypothetical protein